MSARVHLNPCIKPLGQGADISALSPAAADAARAFHSSFNEYRPTPLVTLPGLSARLGLKNIMVKDESQRFGLNAFKVLGGSYAVARHLAERMNLPATGLTRHVLGAPEAQAVIRDTTFITATDGNHGRGLAWTASQLGCRCMVFMPKGSNPARRDNIRALGAECTVTDLNYDDTVRMSWQLAQEKGYVLVQDTAWAGYETIPAWIMQGYTTLAAEVLEQLQQAETMPTHCFLQAGVGSFAAAITGFLLSALGEKAPKFIVVEPRNADCFYQSALAGDGKAHAVSGDLHTLMAGLACGVPSTLCWELLRDYSTAFISSPDYMAANGMRILAAPVRGDAAIISGESGAATTGVMHWLMQHPRAHGHREALQLGPEASVLLISTEGDTVPEVYRRVVWQGAYPDEDPA